MKDLPTNHLNKLNQNTDVLDTSISGSLSISDTDCFTERGVKAVKQSFTWNFEKTVELINLRNTKYLDGMEDTKGNTKEMGLLWDAIRKEMKIPIGSGAIAGKYRDLMSTYATERKLMPAQERGRARGDIWILSTRW